MGWLSPRGTQKKGKSVSMTDIFVYHEICQFLYHESELLDERRFDEWLDLLSEEISYRMPQRATLEKSDSSRTREPSSYFEENIISLRSRTARLATKSAWADDPPARTRHFISNVQVRTAGDNETYQVTSYLNFVCSRGNSSVLDQLTGKREDIICRHNGELKLQRRDVFLDQSVLGTMNLITLY